MPQTQIKMPDGTLKIYDIPDGATKAQIEEFLNGAMAAQTPPSSSSLQSVADLARQRLASRGLTPEAVKAGQSAAPVETQQDGALTRFARGAGIPTSIPEMQGLADSLDPGAQAARGNPLAITGPVGLAAGGLMHSIGAGMGDQAGQALDAAQQGDAKGYLKHSLGAAVPLIGPQMAEDNVAGGLGTAAALALPFAKDVIPGVRPMPNAAADLINNYLGKGSVDTTTGANAGRGISSAKIVGVTARGVQAQVQAAIKGGQAVVKRLLSNPAAQAPTIDGFQLIRDAFGDPPLNITDVTLGRWEDFAGKIAQKIHDLSNGTGKISPAQADALKGQIDVNFGKPTTGVTADPTELNLNQKAASVRRAFDHAVDQQVPGYQTINDHLMDLHHADNILDVRISEPSQPIGLHTIADPVRAFFGSPPPATGTQPGILTTPGRTGLAAMLSERPKLGMVAPTPTSPPATAAWLNNILQKYGQPAATSATVK